MTDMDSRDKDIQEKRRDILRAYIKDVLETSVNAFALKIGRTPSFYNEVLSGKRAFRESLAEKLEAQIKTKGWPPVALRQPSPDDAPKPDPPDPWPFDFAYRRYKDLSERQKGNIEGRLIMFIEQCEEAENADKLRPRRKKSAE